MTKGYLWICFLMIFGLFFLSGGGVLLSGCSLFGGCEKTIKLPPPQDGSFQRTPCGIGVYEDGSNTWNINADTLNAICNQYAKLVSCAENELNADIIITIEPAIEILSSQGQSPQKRSLSEEKPFSMSKNAKPPEELTDMDFCKMYPDECPQLEFKESFPEYNEEENINTAIPSAPRETVLEGILPEDFMLILTEKNACLYQDGVDGVTWAYGSHTAVWVNQLGDLSIHELVHVLAGILHLTEKEEQALAVCHPGAHHVSGF